MTLDSKGCLILIAGVIVIGFVLYAIGSVVVGWF